MPRKAEPKVYRVANPRGIPEGRYILRTGPRGGPGERFWFEGDPYDGDVTPRLLRDGFLVEVSDGEA